jgi:hypothetical protein
MTTGLRDGHVTIIDRQVDTPAHRRRAHEDLAIANGDPYGRSAPFRLHIDEDWSGPETTIRAPALGHHLVVALKAISQPIAHRDNRHETTRDAVVVLPFASMVGPSSQMLISMRCCAQSAKA